MSEPLSMMVSSGNGPGECRQAVAHVLKKMMRDAVQASVGIGIAERPARHGPASAVVQLDGAGASALADRWRGVILWRCASRLRPRHKRKTWFVQVFDLPRVGVLAEIAAEEVEMQALRAGGPGGQHQNKTSSAIRARWGGYAVVVRDQRSQHQNRRLALLRLQEIVAADRAEAKAVQQGQAHWLHHQLQRGDPRRVFQGPDFKEI